MAELLRGAPVADAITSRLIGRAALLRERGIHPCLAILRVGERPDDLAYEKGALNRCEKIGIAVRTFVLPDDSHQAQLMDTIAEIQAAHMPRHLWKPVKVTVPINLRTVFQTETFRNFSLVLNIGVDPRLKDYSLEELCREYKNQLALEAPDSL